VYTKHQLTKTLVTEAWGLSHGVRRREGGREGEVILRVWENAVATEGMLGNLNTLGDGPGRSLADHGARVPEVLPAAELEGFLAGLIIAMPREPVYGAAVGDDVEEAQEFWR